MVNRRVTMTPPDPIPFFNYPALFKRDEQGYMAVLHDVLSRGAFILQRDLAEFEAALRDYLGVRHVFGVADGTNALILGLKALDIGPGDEVIVPSHTYIASAAAVHLVGATPVLADMAPDHMIDPVSVAAKVTPRTRAIMPVQLNGRTCNMDALQAIAEGHGLLIVEDAAQALGSRFGGRCAGTFGAFGTFSFYPAKLLGGFGDGGAVVTDDDAIAGKIAQMRDHGHDAQGRVVSWGTNSRLDNAHAAILNYKFATYQAEIARRRDIAARYQAALGDIAALALPPAPDDDGAHFDVYQNYEIETTARDALRAHLAENGIGTMIQWGGTPVHMFRELGFDDRLPATERFFERCLMLPMHTALRDDEIARICAGIRDFHRSDRRGDAAAA
jgi:dTDP-4-amino-4,6-dideoxygalactose transaminase